MSNFKPASLQPLPPGEQPPGSESPAALEGVAPARPIAPARRAYTLGLLTAVYMLNLVDRGLVMLLLQPIKEDLHLSDTQLGMVTGIAFGLFYAIAGVPIARWADRRNRVRITAAAIGLWGLTVMATVFVANFAQLVAARIFAAVGEAGCKPASYSLVGDYFPGPAERTRAMSVYWLGNPLSSMVSFIAGGWLFAHLGWRMTFLVMGLPGLVLAILVLTTLKDPRARQDEPAAPARPAPLPFKAVLRYLWKSGSCREITAAIILLFTISSGMGPWYAAFLMRSHGMGTMELGLALGLVFGAGGIFGTLAGGYVSARWFASDERGQLRLSAISIALLFPSILVFLFAPDRVTALIALAALMAAFVFFSAPTFALLQRLVPDDMRATTLACVMLLANLIGMGLGPQLVGLLSDVLAPRYGTDSLRYAMLGVALLALWAGLHFWRASARIDADLRSISATKSAGAPASSD